MSNKTVHYIVSTKEDHGIFPEHIWAATREEAARDFLESNSHYFDEFEQVFVMVVPFSELKEFQYERSSWNLVTGKNAA